MMILNSEILGAMTIREAADRWSDPRRDYLQRWGETFGVLLADFHIGHIRTYQLDRGKEVGSGVVDAETDALLALLMQIGLGSEIERHYQPLGQAGELTQSELDTLSEPVRKYIGRLKQEISHIEAENHQMKNQIRKTNWGRNR